MDPNTNTSNGNGNSNKAQGLGDTIEWITTNTGIKYVVKKLSSNLNEQGECTPCEERRKKLNQMFPYNNNKEQ